MGDFIPIAEAIISPHQRRRLAAVVAMADEGISEVPVIKPDRLADDSHYRYVQADSAIMRFDAPGRLLYAGCQLQIR